MTELTPIQKLDYVLNFFATHIVAKKYMPYEVVITHCLYENGSPFENNDMVMILNKLEKDGYTLNQKGIHPTTKQEINLNYITFEGSLFHQMGGYKKEQEDLRRRSNQRVAYTISVAIGTALAGLYGLWEIIKSLLIFFFHGK